MLYLVEVGYFSSRFLPIVSNGRVALDIAAIPLIMENIKKLEYLSYSSKLKIR